MKKNKNMSQIISEICKENNIQKNIINVVLDELVSKMKKEIEENKKFTIKNFGKFQKTHRYGFEIIKFKKSRSWKNE